MKSVSNSLEIIQSLDPLGNPLGGLDTQLLAVKLLVDHVLDLVKCGNTFLVDSLNGGHEEEIVVDGDDRGNLSDLVVKDPPGNFLGLIDCSIT